MKKIICITGPTASGKTALSLEIAKTFNAEIINADSVQMYKELNIGSAKISVSERKNIIHHLLDVTTLDRPITIYDFQKIARETINHVDLPLFVGGSGLYLKSALFNYELLEEDKTIVLPSIEVMKEYIKQHDKTLDMSDKSERHIVSAYKQLLSGHKRTDKKGKDQALYDICMIYLDINRDTLKERVTQRLDIMFNEGFLKEAQELYKVRKELNVIGYRELFEYFKGTISLNEAKSLIITKTMQFAKRQKTWFLNQMSPIIIDGLSPDVIEKATQIVKDFLEVS